MGDTGCSACCLLSAVESVPGAGDSQSGLTSVQQGGVLAQGPQAVERAEPPEHGPQRGRHAGLVRVLVEPAQHRELQEGQRQRAAAVSLRQRPRAGEPAGTPPR